MNNRTAFPRFYRPRIALFWCMLSLALLLTACGGDSIPTIAGPPPTPTPGFRQETNQELFFVMSVPVNWVKTSEQGSVTFTANDDPNVKLSVTSVKASKVTIDSTRYLQAELDKRKARYTSFVQDNAGLLRLVDNTFSLYKVSYTDNTSNVVEYMAQVNVPQSEQAYLLAGRSLVASGDRLKTIFTSSFESFKSNAPLTVPASLTAGANEAGVASTTNGGTITGDRITPGKVNTLADWQSPSLSYGSTRFTVSGYFPLNWQWRIKSFPLLDPGVLAATSTPGVGITPAAVANSLANPGLYVTAPNQDAFIQLGIIPNVFPSEAPPSADDYKKALDPYLKSFNLSLNGLGSRNSISELTNVGTFFRTTFVARSDNGATNARGVVLFRSAGRHLLMGVVTLSPTASLKQNLIDGYDADIQSIISSVQVKTVQ